jgi:hypothetical protein
LWSIAEVIADNPKADCSEAASERLIQVRRTIWIDVHRCDGRRFFIRADEWQHLFNSAICITIFFLPNWRDFITLNAQRKKYL